MEEQETWKLRAVRETVTRQRTWIARPSLCLFPYKCIPSCFRKGWWNITFNEYFSFSCNTRPSVFILFHLRVCFPSFFFHFFCSSLLDVSKLKCLMVEGSPFRKIVDPYPGKYTFFYLHMRLILLACTIYISTDKDETIRSTETSEIVLHHRRMNYM